MNLVSRQLWLSQKPEVRVEIARLFSIPKSTFSEVVNNVQVCDGYTDTDLANITLGKMCQFLNTNDNNFLELFQAVVIAVENKLLANVVKSDVVKNDEQTKTEPSKVVEPKGIQPPKRGTRKASGGNKKTKKVS